MRIDAAATATRASRGPIFGILLLPIHDLPTGAFNNGPIAYFVWEFLSTNFMPPELRMGMDFPFRVGNNRPRCWKDRD